MKAIQWVVKLAAAMLVGSLALAVARASDEPRSDGVRAAVQTSGTAAISVELDRKSSEVKDNIELFQARIQRKMEKIEKILTGLDLRKIEAQKVAVDELREMLDELDAEAGAILEADAQVRPDLKKYRESLLEAPGVFVKIADGFDRRAEAVRSRTLKEAYADFSAEARKHAGTYTKRAKDVEELEKAIQKQLEFVVESREFISDMRGFLAAVPANSGLATERWVARINEYIAAFESAIKAIKGVSEKIAEPAPSADPAGGKKPAPRQAHSGRATTLDEYSARLAELKR